MNTEELTFEIATCATCEPLSEEPCANCAFRTAALELLEAVEEQLPNLRRFHRENPCTCTDGDEVTDPGVACELAQVHGYVYRAARALRQVAGASGAAREKGPQ